ncbi:hypothetical protein ACHAWF_018834, partial [Thalassiosira exigua]
ERGGDGGEGGKRGAGGPLRCRGIKGRCPNAPVMVCKIASHSRGICQRCADRETDVLLGPTGSTHIYNGHVGRVDGAGGKLYVTGFFSRKAQMDENGKPRAIHWRSTRRIAVPNLVGIIRLGDASSVPANYFGKADAYRALDLHDRIHWGEVAAHGNQMYEDKERQQGRLCVNLASPSIFEPDNAPDLEHEFSEGDIVAIIDCQTFVAEYMPVIRAYEQQRNEPLPFNDGQMLNLDASRPADLTNTVLGADAQNKAAAEESFQDCIQEQFGSVSLISNNGDDPKNSRRKKDSALPKPLIQSLVADMVAKSTLLPLREIRQNAALSQQMQAELVSLIEKATPDFGQLVNWIDSLRNEVHCTQGPPGTGKSYLGVQIVHALAVIRKYWMQQNRSVGSPPILVLSYKNHATDEFLSDLLKSMGPALSGTKRFNYSGNFYSGSSAQLVRMGNPGDPSLAPFSEKSLAQQRRDPDVQNCQREVHDLQDLRRACQRAQKSATLFQSYQSDMFDSMGGLEGLSPEDIRKRQNVAAYEATEVLFAAIVRSHLLQKFANDHDLKLMASVLNKDAPDDKTFRLLQQHGLRYQSEISESLATLFEGIQHYIDIDASYGDPHEMLYMFLLGQHPKPACSYREVDEVGDTTFRCEQIADWQDTALCRRHRCVLPTGSDGGRCPNEIHHSKKGMLCAEHMCHADDCDQARIRIGQEIEDRPGVSKPVMEKFCLSHSCFQCVKMGISPAMEALDEPPRNVCEVHPLCSVIDCLKLAENGEDYCGAHLWKPCQFIDKNGQQCRSMAISSELPCCRRHVESWLNQKTTVEVDDAPLANMVDSSTYPTLAAALKMNSSSRNCKGLNRKKKPCKALAMVGSDYCEAHSAKDDGFKAQQTERAAEFQRLEEERASKKNNEELPTEPNDTSKGGENSAGSTGSNENLDSDNSSHNSSSEDSAYGPPPDLDNVDRARSDNIDEMDEGDGAAHIREIFEIESGDDEEDSGFDDEFQDAVDHLEGTIANSQSMPFHESALGKMQAPKPPVKDPKDWSWKLSLDERWSACQAFMLVQCEELVQIQSVVKAELPQSRKRLREAESRARARVFENKTVIGGTIVGCITRLEAIRATRPTRPFAVIVRRPAKFSSHCSLHASARALSSWSSLGTTSNFNPTSWISMTSCA